MEKCSANGIVKAKPIEKPDFSGNNVLLVEDNRLNQEIAAEILRQVGIKVDIAGDGEIAVEKVKEAAAGQYDMILMDILMPRMNGYEATRQIRALDDPEKSGLPIVAMTANAFEEDKKEAENAGMNGHIAKPVDIDKLFEMLARFISKKE
ncbi:MAG: response regulator [Oscillospiraceae bacterium]|nr:response regulator [Oscillospiraceae bacterium]